jgi:hypothetical protein
MWAFMIRHVKKYFAVRSYVKRLSQDLVRRFGKRSFYSVEHVTQAVQRGGFSMAFTAYAHAAFCIQEDFDAYYQPLGFACSYQGLRHTIARRYFSGDTDFDAETIFNRFRCGDGNFYESGIGEDYSGH